MEQAIPLLSGCYSRVASMVQLQSLHQRDLFIPHDAEEWRKLRNIVRVALTSATVLDGLDRSNPDITLEAGTIQLLNDTSNLQNEFILNSPDDSSGNCDAVAMTLRQARPAFRKVAIANQ